MSGIAVGHAIALGLHVRCTSKDLSDVDKQYRYRLWWAIYMLMRAVSQLTGRPTCIATKDISVPLPRNINESDLQGKASLPDADEIQQGMTASSDESDDRPYDTGPRSRASGNSDAGSERGPDYTFNPTILPMTDSAVFIYRVRLHIITDRVFNHLYSPATVKLKWSQIKAMILSIDRDLKQWRDTLPLELDFGNPASERFPQYEAERIGLRLLYSSSRMTLYRPALCRLDNQGHAGGPGDMQDEFNISAVNICIDSAREVIAYLGEDINPQAFYRINPFWATIHYLVEASIILILELAYAAKDVHDRKEDLLRDAKRASKWMNVLGSAGSVAADKAAKIYSKLLSTSVRRVGQKRSLEGADLEESEKSSSQSKSEQSTGKASKSGSWHEMVVLPPLRNAEETMGLSSPWDSFTTSNKRQETELTQSFAAEKNRGSTISPRMPQHQQQQQFGDQKQSGQPQQQHQTQRQQQQQQLQQHHLPPPPIDPGHSRATQSWVNAQTSLNEAYPVFPTTTGADYAPLSPTTLNVFLAQNLEGFSYPMNVYGRYDAWTPWAATASNAIGGWGSLGWPGQIDSVDQEMGGVDVMGGPAGNVSNAEQMGGLVGGAMPMDIDTAEYGGWQAQGQLPQGQPVQERHDKHQEHQQQNQDAGFHQHQQSQQQNQDAGFHQHQQSQQQFRPPHTRPQHVAPMYATGSTGSGIFQRLQGAGPSNPESVQSSLRPGLFSKGVSEYSTAQTQSMDTSDREGSLPGRTAQQGPSQGKLGERYPDPQQHDPRPPPYLHEQQYPQSQQQTSQQHRPPAPQHAYPAQPPQPQQQLQPQPGHSSSWFAAPQPPPVNTQTHMGWTTLPPPPELVARTAFPQQKQQWGGGAGGSQGGQGLGQGHQLQHGPGGAGEMGRSQGGGGDAGGSGRGSGQGQGQGQGGSGNTRAY
jgi:hypothetical protein